ncbi:MAG TPA: hypothetical protein VI789_02315, partial [Dehalococcoidia bacterium]|nr:hypothetical protein [Dehalococcoidia bacterium]
MRIGTAAMAVGLVLMVGLAACSGGGSDSPGRTPTLTATPSSPGDGGSAVDIPPADPPDDSASITVTGEGDVNARDGKVTLREALLLATGELSQLSLDEREGANLTESPGVESADTIVFDPEVFQMEEPLTIILSASLPALGSGFDTLDASGAGVVVDGSGEGG